MPQWYKLLALIIIVFSIIMVGIGEVVKPLMAEHFDGISSYPKAYAFGAYTVTAILATAFAVPLTALIVASAGFLFGPVYGTLIGIFCLAVGSLIMFLVTRRYLRHRISRKYEAEILKLNAGMEKHGLKYLLFLRISPFPPVSVANVAMSVTKISAFNFFWVSAIGWIPAVGIYAYLGSKVASMALF